MPQFMLPEWAEQFARSGDEPIQVVTLNSRFDLSDVRDVVRAYRLLLSSSTEHLIYNVGSGTAVLSLDVFRQLERLTGRRREAVERSPGQRQHPVADISRLVQSTRWEPQFPLERTIADTLSDFRARASRASAE